MVLKHNLKCVKNGNIFVCNDIMDIICNIHKTLLLLCLKSPNAFKMKCREITAVIRSM